MADTNTNSISPLKIVGDWVAQNKLTAALIGTGTVFAIGLGIRQLTKKPQSAKGLSGYKKHKTRKHNKGQKSLL